MHSVSTFDSRPALARLTALVSAVPDPDFAGRMRRVYAAAARALAGLGELDLGKYVELSGTGTPDLSVWEQLAPVIRNTLVDVNALLAAVREMFPSDPAGGIADLIGEALDEAAQCDKAAAELERRKREARHHVEVLTGVIAGEVSNLGERMRSPQVVSDRWNLLADLQEFRGKFRAAIGDLVFLSASALAPVTREAVVPGWAEDLEESIAARRVVTDLARVLGAHHARLRDAAPAERAERLRGLLRDVDAFGRSRAYVLLRVPDKRRFVELRAQLAQHEAAPESAAAVATVGELVRFAQGLSLINRRAGLVEHDREVIAACGVLLEMALAARRDRPADAARCLADAALAAEELYGRHPALDGWLRKSRKRDLAAEAGPALDAELEALRTLLATAAGA